jgi:hypothetical protein
MTALPIRTDPIADAIDARLIGHSCDRYIWLAFRWAIKEGRHANFSHGTIRQSGEHWLNLHGLEYAPAIKCVTDRAEKIALSDDMPDPVSTRPDVPPCLFCDFKTFCHETRKTNAVNCRTCAHSTARPDGTWFCERWGAPPYNRGAIPLDVQRKGCADHVIHPAMFPYTLDDALTTPLAAYYQIDGVSVCNGHADARVYSSAELLADPVGCARGQAEVNSALDAFGGKVVEVRRDDTTQ